MASTFGTGIFGLGTKQDIVLVSFAVVVGQLIDAMYPKGGYASTILSKHGNAAIVGREGGRHVESWLELFEYVLLQRSGPGAVLAITVMTKTNSNAHFCWMKFC
jgi:hypothetical protein